MKTLSHFSTAQEKKAAKKRANEALAKLSQTYHQGLPLGQIDDILTANGFNAMEEAIYCGHDGRAHEPIGENTWISFSWHKMDSGRYEVTIYIS